MPLDANLNAELQQVTLLHGALVDFGKLCKQISENVGTSYNLVFQLPRVITGLFSQRARYIAAGISDVRVQEVLGAGSDYSDVGLLFGKLDALRTLIENNTGALPITWDIDHNLQHVTASSGVQTTISAQMIDVMSHFVNL